MLYTDGNMLQALTLHEQLKIGWIYLHVLQIKINPRVPNDILSIKTLLAKVIINLYLSM